MTSPAEDTAVILAAYRDDRAIVSNLVYEHWDRAQLETVTDDGEVCYIIPSSGREHWLVDDELTQLADAIRDGLAVDTLREGR